MKLLHTPGPWFNFKNTDIRAGLANQNGEHIAKLTRGALDAPQTGVTNMEQTENEQSHAGAPSALNVGLERALIPSGYLCLHEGGYNHEEVPVFSPVRLSGSGPCNLTRCWPIYDLAAVIDATERVRSIASIWAHGDKETEANARLIAAAPDLLEALAMSLKTSELRRASGVESGPLLDAEIRRSRAAIKKAMEG